MRAFLVMVSVSCLLGCLPKVPRQRLAERAKVAVAYVVDPGYSGASYSPPEALQRAIRRELDEHNLEVVDVPLEALASQRLTDARFEALRRTAPDASFFLLVEQRVHFFSQLDGRYRWEVAVALTASRRDGAMAKDPFEIPVILMYDHEKEREAIASAALDISNRVGLLMDGLMVGVAATASGLKAAGIYFAMVDRFANGDPANDGEVDLGDSQAFHGGDLQGVIDHLDWIQSLGFDTVWLSPIFTMRTQRWNGHGAFHGYWTWDFFTLEPKFGDELVLARLRSELDRRGMKLILDVVLNHVGPDAPLLAEKPLWFHRNGGITDWENPTQWVMNDVHGLPDLATENPEVFAHLLGAARRWL